MDLRAMFSLIPLLLLGLCCAQDGTDFGSDDDTAATDITDLILRMNNGSADILLEGDVLFPENRNAMKCLKKAYSCLWQKTGRGLVEVPYTISQKYDNNEKNEIESTMKSFADVSCIRFVPRAKERAYVAIEPKYGCASQLGRLGHRQKVTLQKFGCIQRGIIQHELLHTLGFYHEHTRSDRDNHIKINWDNVQKAFLFNFEKKDNNDLGTKYDYNSVMHYGRTAFGKNRKETIIPFPDNSARIGQREAMSKIDIVRLNKLYKC
ncbi:low choriolytic enzyme-like [Clinocottus analis]|uniref:low choriolytic enzyme-like n=1 Tax=Clinocottus analis TaxID=304258 RepID=UPI0035C1670A